jgi:AhpD family alkylhydroperoxidase
MRVRADDAAPAPAEDLPVDHGPTHAELSRRIARMADAAPAVMTGFGKLHAATQSRGALDRKVKELMALAISVAVHCDGCVTYHLHDALAAGATREEVVETVGVAVMMGGGPAVLYGAQALEALERGSPSLAAAQADLPGYDEGTAPRDS